MKDSLENTKKAFTTRETILLVILGLIIGLSFGLLFKNKSNTVQADETDNKYIKEFIKNYDYIVNNYYIVHYYYLYLNLH